MEPLSGIDIIEETFQRFDSEAAIAAQIKKEGLITESEGERDDEVEIQIAEGKARVAELRQAKHASVYAAALSAAAFSAAAFSAAAISAAAVAACTSRDISPCRFDISS